MFGDDDGTLIVDGTEAVLLRRAPERPVLGEKIAVAVEFLRYNPDEPKEISLDFEGQIWGNFRNYKHDGRDRACAIMEILE